MDDHCIGERCCYEEFKGIVRYIGEVPPTEGNIYFFFMCERYGVDYNG